MSKPPPPKLLTKGVLAGIAQKTGQTTTNRPNFAQTNLKDLNLGGAAAEMAKINCGLCFFVGSCKKPEKNLPLDPKMDPALV